MRFFVFFFFFFFFFCFLEPHLQHMEFPRLGVKLDLLYSTGKSTQHSIITYTGKKKKDKKSHINAC